MKTRNEQNKEKKRSVVHPAFLIITGVLIVGVIVFLIFFLNTRKIEEGMYYYDTGVKYQQQGSSTISKDNDDRVYMQNGPSGQKIELGSAPLYYNDQDRLFLPQVTTISAPSKKTVHKMEQYAELEYKQGKIIAHVGEKQYEIEEGFLYDGKDTFVFLDKMTIHINDRVIEMQPLSYAIVVYNQRIEFYPYGKEPVVEQTGPAEVIARAEQGYSVDLSKCILKNAEGFESLLISEPSLMEPFLGHQ